MKALKVSFGNVWQREIVMEDKKLRHFIFVEI